MAPRPPHVALPIFEVEEDVFFLETARVFFFRFFTRSSLAWDYHPLRIFDYQGEIGPRPPGRNLVVPASRR